MADKSDLPGADRMRLDIEIVLHMRETGSAWRAKVRLTNSQKGSGTREILDNIDAHPRFLREEGLLADKRCKGDEERIRLLVNDRITPRFWTRERRTMLKEYGRKCWCKRKKDHELPSSLN